MITPVRRLHDNQELTDIVRRDDELLGTGPEMQTIRGE
jgi:hypothetical protein